MIRPFDLRDLPLIYRLSEQGASFHTEFALINHPQLLRKALVSMIGVGHYPTYVWKDEKGESTGFVQLYLEDSSHAHIVHVALAADANNEDVWLPLLEQLVAETGRQGVHSLVAEVNEDSPVLAVLRQAGFAVYTRQDVWVLPADAALPVASHPLRRRESIDDWDIQLLYANTVPRLVQLVEPSPPLVEDAGLVLRDDGELAAFVHTRAGEAGLWLRIYLHPRAEVRAGDIIAGALATRDGALHQPVYCCVRRYQSWLQNDLARVGFQHWGTQAVMVKHTVQRTKSAAQDLASVLEAKGVKGSAPVVQRYEQPEPITVLEHKHS